MSRRARVAINWAGACGGCDVSLLDTEERLLDLTAEADVVYWPVAMDFKRRDLEAYGEGEIDVGIFNGAIRTSEHLEDARILRSRCRVLVAWGACACFGGIPGLANLHYRKTILDTMYSDTPSTDNPQGTRPQPTSEVANGTLELPEIEDTVRSLGQVVDVDCMVPGCPPPGERVEEALEMILRLARTGSPPVRGSVLAADNALCDECDRVNTRSGGRMNVVKRVHEVIPDPELCFLEQGMVCLGLATRGGCGATCIGVNMPCRGCFGPLPSALDPAADALSAIGSIAGAEHEDDLDAAKRNAAVRSITDLAGTFYRFTLPAAAIPRRVDDRPKDGEEESR